MEFKFVHPRVQQWMEITGETNLKKSPWYKSLADDIDPYDRIDLQGAIQQHIDHSVSSTINLKENVTQKTVREIYEYAWKSGKVKGLTVYRKNCRDGVILDLDKSPETGIIKVEAPERPRELPCDVHHITVSGRKYFVLVGLYGDNRKPYEVFAGRNGFLPAKVKSGTIIRKRKGYYVARFNDSDIELSPIMAAADEMEEAVTRLTSTALRHHTEIQFLVAQLEKVGEKGDFHNFVISVARALKKYIPDGTEEKGVPCPACNAKPIIRQDGCITCTACGWSKCL
jgi:ribonucleoside-diphosphate reductase alpha chain